MTFRSDVATGIQTFGNRFNAYLPSQSAAIDLLFGIGRGIEDQNFANSYINPASPLPGLPDFSDQLVAFIQQYQTDQATRNGVTGSIATLTPSQAWAVFETLPDYRQRILIESALFQILNQTGLDYNNAASPYHLQYARGYQAINTLFPAADGYTANNLGGGANGANAPVSTGYLDMRGSTVQTQQGGNISILGPGGRILVGSSSAPPYIVDSNGRTLVGPNNQGILTLETGNIDIFSDQSILLAQSRIFTEQGGDIVIWSSNGDINAGKGVKTTSEIPPPQYVCDPTGYCTVDAKHCGDPDQAGCSRGQRQSDCPPRDGGCGRRRHPGLGQSQYRGAVHRKRLQHPSARRDGRCPDGRGPADRRADHGRKHRRRHSNSIAAAVERQRQAQRHHRGGARLWWRRRHPRPAPRRRAPAQ